MIGSTTRSFVQRQHAGRRSVPKCRVIVARNYIPEASCQFREEQHSLWPSGSAAVSHRGDVVETRSISTAQPSPQLSAGKSGAASRCHNTNWGLLLGLPAPSAQSRAMVNKITWQKAGSVIAPGPAMFTFGWLIITAEEPGSGASSQTRCSLCSGRPTKPTKNIVWAHSNCPVAERVGNESSTNRSGCPRVEFL
jgi:hypothetical protein